MVRAQNLMSATWWQLTHFAPQSPHMHDEKQACGLTEYRKHLICTWHSVSTMEALVVEAISLPLYRKCLTNTSIYTLFLKKLSIPSKNLKIGKTSFVT